uniref:Arginine and glutamate-rich protein 1 n=1 Tax=Timema cristinae TaxID=61476 RepID=A0A7R9CI44_TIMCR|nr:unnamed protein product [Timema cristinae]
MVLDCCAHAHIEGGWEGRQDFQVERALLLSQKRSHTESSSSSSDLSDEGTRTNHVRKRYNDRKMDEVERLAEMERQRRQRELEQKMVEEETAKRIEELVKKRVEEELEKRKEEIEAEVLRRVEEAKKIMEHQMMEEMERRRQLQLEEEKKRETEETIVSTVLKNAFEAEFTVAAEDVFAGLRIDKEEERKKREELEAIMAENNRKIEEAQKKLAEERLAMVEEQRKMEEERQRLKKEQEKRVKEEQKKILGKNNSRPKLSFSLKPAVS